LSGDVIDGKKNLGSIMDEKIWNFVGGALLDEKNGFLLRGP